QILTGGNGGKSSTDVGGAGGKAISSLTFDDTIVNTIKSNALTGISTANGGAAGNSGTGAAGIKGGQASSTIAMTGATVTTANANATGGAGGGNTTGG